MASASLQLLTTPITFGIFQIVLFTYQDFSEGVPSTQEIPQTVQRIFLVKHFWNKFVSEIVSSQMYIPQTLYKYIYIANVCVNGLCTNIVPWLPIFMKFLAPIAF